ncbi:Clavaminate synthase-like protein [Microthyrium microscopicum]|uniref:Clavaminate synthase-like protein n=1 Tax=Microthyrium microscopicum TaxID=703497 RepID=A0A6A6UH40_9PEZI|nr:Clavaminate synthase-like protein [Microthyrium microscopicum]
MDRDTNPQNESSKSLNSAIKDLLRDYNDLNSSTIDELPTEPSPLEFHRYVAQNRPFVIRNAAKSFSAYDRWSASYLTKTLANSPVCVAVTPLGNADAPLRQENGDIWLVKPHETTLPFNEAFDLIRDGTGKNTVYLQSQDGNLKDEYAALAEDVPPDIPWARVALGRGPDAVNVWIGNERSKTALHKDPYENVYVQVRGAKRFTLLPPVAVAGVGERLLKGARYVPKQDATEGLGVEEVGLEARLDGDGASVPFPTWDPDGVTEVGEEGGLRELCRPVRVRLGEGDMLYLPALWFHQVEQECGNEEFCCAVNYWYDMEYSGSFYALAVFARNVANAAIGGTMGENEQ